MGGICHCSTSRDETCAVHGDTASDGHATIGAMLASLAVGWRLDLVTIDDGRWRLALEAKSGERRRHTHYGTLDSVVARAFAGERGDS